MSTGIMFILGLFVMRRLLKEASRKIIAAVLGGFFAIAAWSLSYSFPMVGGLIRAIISLFL